MSKRDWEISCWRLPNGKAAQTIMAFHCERIPGYPNANHAFWMKSPWRESQSNFFFFGHTTNWHSSYRVMSSFIRFNLWRLLSFLKHGDILGLEKLWLGEVSNVSLYEIPLLEHLQKHRSALIDIQRQPKECKNISGKKKNVCRNCIKLQ